MSTKMSFLGVYCNYFCQTRYVNLSGFSSNPISGSCCFSLSKKPYLTV